MLKKLNVIQRKKINQKKPVNLILIHPSNISLIDCRQIFCFLDKKSYCLKVVYLYPCRACPASDHSRNKPGFRLERRVTLRYHERLTLQIVKRFPELFAVYLFLLLPHTTFLQFLSLIKDFTSFCFSSNLSSPFFYPTSLPI